MELKVIAHIRTDFPEKFGIPRQSGLTEAKGEIIFEKEYASLDVLKGIEEFSHLWIIWGFSENFDGSWSPTVRPPRLGGNERKGVFATRSPFRPNPIGLSCVQLDGVEFQKNTGLVLKVTGVDMMDNTPVYDIKPYLPYVDIRENACGGFTNKTKDYRLDVDISDECVQKVPSEHRKILIEILSQDPRPSYQNDPNRIYGITYADMNIRFKVNGNVLTVYEICKMR